jgi:hypothetical protein
VVIALSSVVVRDLDFEGVSIAPDETETPLIIDSDAVLPLPATLQFFQPVARRHSKILKRNSAMQEKQFSPRRSLQVPEPRHISIVEEPLGIRRPEGTNHLRIISVNGKRYMRAAA